MREKKDKTRVTKKKINTKVKRLNHCEDASSKKKKINTEIELFHFTKKIVDNVDARDAVYFAQFNSQNFTSKKVRDNEY